MTDTNSNIDVEGINASLVKDYDKTRAFTRFTSCIALLTLLLISIFRAPYIGVFFDAIIFDYLFGIGKYFVYPYLLVLLIFKLLNKPICKIFFNVRAIVFTILISIFILVLISAINWLSGNHNNIAKNFGDPLRSYQLAFNDYFSKYSGKQWSSNFVNPYISGGIIGEFFVALAFVFEWGSLIIFEFVILFIAIFVLCGFKNSKIVSHLRNKLIIWLGGEPKNTEVEKEEIEDKSKPNVFNLNSIKVEALDKTKLVPPISFLSYTSTDNYDKNHTKALKLTNQLKELWKTNAINLTLASVETMPLFNEIKFTYHTHDDLKQVFRLNNDILDIFNVEKLNMNVKNNNITFEVPNKDPSSICIKNVLTSIDNIKPMQATIGVTYSNYHLFLDLNINPTVLIVGKPGSGAVMNLSSIILSAAYTNNPQQLKMALLSTQNESIFDSFSKLPHMLSTPTSSFNDTYQSLVSLIGEVDRRKKLLSSERVSDISEYNSLNQDQQLANILVVIYNVDEFLNYSTSNQDILLELLKKDANKAGIKLIMYAKSIDGFLWTDKLQKHTSSYFIYKAANEAVSNLFLKSTRAMDLFGNGDGYWLNNKDKSKTRIQSCYVNKQEIQDVVKIIETFYEIKKSI